MKSKILKAVMFIIMLAVVCSGWVFADGIVVPQEKALKTLNSNKKPDEIIVEMPVDGMMITNSGYVSFPFMHNAKFKVKTNLESELLKERISHLDGRSVKVTFTLVDKKEKIYNLKSVEGLETVAECNDRIESEENMKQGLGYITNQKKEQELAANEEEGFGKITDFQKESQIAANKAAGFGEITDFQKENQIAANKAAGFGEITDFQKEYQIAINKTAGFGEVTRFQKENQIAANKEKGLGEITDFQKSNQIDANKSAGFGEITDFQKESQIAANKAAGFGEITDFQKLNQIATNKAAGFGEVTRFQKENQIAANKAAGFGEITDFQKLNQIAANKAVGLGEITDYQKECQIAANKAAGKGENTDFQVEKQIAANETAGLGKITDTEVAAQKESNKNSGFGEITDQQKLTQMAANKAAGKGNITDFQKQQQIAANKAAGKGSVTDYEINHKTYAEAKAYEAQGRYCYALGKYYDYLSSDVPAEDKLEAVYAYNKLKDTIESGNPGYGTFDEFQMHDQWIKLLIDADKYERSHDFYHVSRIIGLQKGSLDYQTKTASYSCSIELFFDSRRYDNVVSVIYNGLREAKKSDWNDISVPENKSVRSANDYELTINIVDLAGNELLPAQSRNGSGSYSFTGVEPEIISKIDSGNAKVNFISMKYGNRLLPRNSYCVGVEEIEKKNGNFQNAKNQLKQKLNMVNIPGKNFKMLNTEVTQKLYTSVMGSNPSYYKGGNNPVEWVSWYDTIYFCNKLSEKSGFTPVYSVNGTTDVNKWNYTPHEGNSISGKVTQNTSANGYRLPTNDEWEYAAKGGRYYDYAGSDNLDEVGWYEDNSGDRTHPVAQKKANGYGLYDMSGNVWEWIWDSDSAARYIRGGSYNFTDRYELDDCDIERASDRRSDIGFRIVCFSN